MYRFFWGSVYDKNIYNFYENKINLYVTYLGKYYMI